MPLLLLLEQAAKATAPASMRRKARVFMGESYPGGGADNAALYVVVNVPIGAGLQLVALLMKTVTVWPAKNAVGKLLAS